MQARKYYVLMNRFSVLVYYNTHTHMNFGIKFSDVTGGGLTYLSHILMHSF